MGSASSRESGITIERIERAIAMTAYVMQRHDLPQLLPTLKRLETARDELMHDGDALEYARRVLARGAVSVDRCKMLPSPPSTNAA
jgi:hypothetical protein